MEFVVDTHANHTVKLIFAFQNYPVKIDYVSALFPFQLDDNFFPLPFPFSNR